jgi:hypothetical protein
MEVNRAPDVLPSGKEPMVHTGLEARAVIRRGKSLFFVAILTEQSWLMWQMGVTPKIKFLDSLK